MKKRYYQIIGLLALLLGACTEHDAPAGHPDVPQGKVAVEFQLPTQVEGFNDGLATPVGTRAADGEKDGTTLEGKPVVKLDDGSTLWIMATKVQEAGGKELEPEETVNSYVVRNVGQAQVLHPCICDKEGNLESETSIPMLLDIGATYRFRAVSPARAFAKVPGKETDHALYVENKQYVIATDERYTQTCATEIEINTPTEDAMVQIVKINPLIHQTAQLEFTIQMDEETGVNQLDVLPQGVEVSGTQTVYNKGNDTPWNWSLGDTLTTYVGDLDSKVLIRKGTGIKERQFITKDAKNNLYVRFPILPTDAFSSSIIVLFNLEVNGSPTQFTTLLNRKVFRSGFTYHYVGKVSLVEGVAVITWQYVSWEGEAPIIPIIP